MRSRGRKRSRVARFGATALVLAAMVSTPFAAEKGSPDGAPLPNPLTLGQALALADEAHPDLALAQANVLQARSRRREAQARTGTQIFGDLTPQVTVPSEPFPGESGWVNDSRARLFLNQPLYDFGRSAALERAADAEVDAREQMVLDAQQLRRLEIMGRFFDVLLADLRYGADNEDMARKYVEFDRLRERASLGQVSEVDLLAAENRYREALIVRTDSEKRKTATRQQLAVALNRPAELPGELVRPMLANLDREIPDHQLLYQQASAVNPQLQSLRAEVAAGRSAYESERARRYPILSGELEAAAYERGTPTRDQYRATLNLRVPLYDGGQTDAALQRAAAEVVAREARLAKGEQALRQQALDLVQELEALKVRRVAARQRMQYRDLYLERSRALYELEVRTDLGDAMTQLSDAQWQEARADFQMALAWARLDALLGRLVQSQTETNKP